MSKKVLEAKARRLAAKFVEDAQKIFNDDRMSDAIYDDGVMQALLAAQQSAEDCVDCDA